MLTLVYLTIGALGLWAAITIVRITPSEETIEAAFRAFREEDQPVEPDNFTHLQR